MKTRLKTFTDFVHSLYPHEIHYLLHENKLQSPEALKILQLIHYNSQNPRNRLPFDPAIDKRKYSNLKNWIEKKLLQLDVDRFFVWINEMKQKIMTDSIEPEEEKSLLQHLGSIYSGAYYFPQFFELVQHFRDFLLIRMRVVYYQQVSDFLSRYDRYYKRSVAINNKLNDASFDIIRQHAYSRHDSQQWINLLTRTFRDQELDGYTRYRAVVRLMYIYYIYRRFDEMKAITDELDLLLRSPAFYSKRILANYYANRALMHQKRGELDLAGHYGYLSVRQKNSDYLFYINNLCYILLKEARRKEALQLMQQTLPDLKRTNSFYNRVGFVSLYLRTLIANGRAAQAESYGDTFSQTYKKEIFAHRWHLFYSAYLQTLLNQGKYQKLLTTVRRNKLIRREREFLGNAGYLPTIQWYYQVAAYLQAEINEADIQRQLRQSLEEMQQNLHKKKKIKDLIREVKPHIPDVVRQIDGNW